VTLEDIIDADDDDDDDDDDGERCCRSAVSAPRRCNSRRTSLEQAEAVREKNKSAINAFLERRACMLDLRTLSKGR
jgi:hypothetical protein